jgi:hypothetical protein
MARRKVNKSQKIRDYIGQHPEAGPTEVARALKRYGVSVSLVSAIKGRNRPARRKRRKAKATRRTVRGRRARFGASIQAAPIIAAAELIRACGGVEEAKAAVDAAGRVASALQ